jgi:hypothetical protein
MTRFLAHRNAFAGTVEDVCAGLSITAIIIGGVMLACGVFGS